MNVLWNEVLYNLKGQMHSRNITPNPVEGFLNLISVRGILAVLAELSKDYDESGAPPRQGCVIALCFLNRNLANYPAGLSFASRGFGELILPQATGWMKNASEKVGRIIQRRLNGSLEVDSYDSADPENPNPALRTYGGALCMEYGKFDLIPSVSGGPSWVDRAMAYVVGVTIEPEFSPPSHFPTSPDFELALQIYNRNI